MGNNQGSDDIQQNRDIIKEVESINIRGQDQNAYKKTKYWHQQSADMQALGQTDQLAKIFQCLERMEEKIDKLGKMVKS